MFMKELRELKSSNEQVASDFKNTTEELRKEILLLHQNQQKIERRLDSLNSVVAMAPSSAPSFPSSPCIQPHEITSYSPSVLFSPSDYGLLSGPPLQPQQHSPSFMASMFAACPSPGVPSPCYDSYFARTEILSYLPFLSNYNLQSPEVPFVVDHLRYANCTISPVTHSHITDVHMRVCHLHLQETVLCLADHGVYAWRRIHTTHLRLRQLCVLFSRSLPSGTLCLPSPPH
jgi:hypothetical protein